MREFLTRILFEFLTGYVRIIKATGVFILRMLLLCCFSFLIVFPPWYFAIHYKTGYNIFIFICLLLIILYITGTRIMRYTTREFRLGHKTEFKISALLMFEILDKTVILFNFLVLVSELCLIHYLLLNDQILFFIAGMVLAVEFLVFLCLIKQNKKVLASWMKTALIILTTFEFIYTGSVLFTRGDRLYALCIGVIYLFVIGYLLYKPGIIKKNEDQIRI